MIWYQNSSKYDFDGVLLENKRNFFGLLHENVIHKVCPEILCVANEFFEIPVRSAKENSILNEV